MFVYVYKIATNTPRLPEVAQTARSRHQKHRRRRPGDDQATLMVERNSAIYVCLRQAILIVDRNSAIYVCLRLQDRNSGGSFAADGGFRRSLKWHVANVKNIAGVGPAMTRID